MTDPDPAARPIRAVAFDVIGTLFSLETQRPLLVAAGLPPHALERWFATALRDLFAFGAMGRFMPMRPLLEQALRALLAETGAAPPEARIEAVLDGMNRLAPRDGAGAALDRLRAAGLPLLAASNGGLAATRALLERAGLASRFEVVMSVDEVGAAKPRPEVYRAAAARLDLPAGALAMAAAHPWDLEGALAAGFGAGFHLRLLPFPAGFAPPAAASATLPGLADAILLRLDRAGRPSGAPG